MYTDEHQTKYATGWDWLYIFGYKEAHRTDNASAAVTAI